MAGKPFGRHISVPLEDKMLVWLEQGNQYIAMELPACEVFLRLANDADERSVSSWFSKAYRVSDVEASRFIAEVGHSIEQVLQEAGDRDDDRSGSSAEDACADEPGFSSGMPQNPQSPVVSTFVYLFGTTPVTFEYGHAQLEALIHPLLAHLEVKGTASQERAFVAWRQARNTATSTSAIRGQNDIPASHIFSLNLHDQKASLHVNGTFIGSYRREESHLLKGKIFLWILNVMYGNSESDWAGTFHASAVARGNKSVMLAGSSGEGKSTAAAILMAAGFSFLSDDFVPLSAGDMQVYPFPVAISIKEKAFDLVTEMYPSLASVPIFEYKAAGKTVKYLAPGGRPEDYSTPDHLSENFSGPLTSGKSLSPRMEERRQKGSGKSLAAILFIQYKPGASTHLSEVPKAEALQQLVTDSWVSPLYDHVEKFLHWFSAIPCYRLTYSENADMIGKIEELFDDAT